MKWFLEQFPEDLFPCTANSYTEKILNGAEIAKRSRVMIAGLVRDSYKNLWYNIHRIDKLCSFFMDYRVFLYENDSNDGTPKLLQSWAEKDRKVSFLSEKLKKQRHEQTINFERTIDMAYYRNKYVPEILKWDGDYIIIYDFDLLGGFSYEGIFSSLYYSENIHGDVFGSNGLYFTDNNRRLYFDSWASRGTIFNNLNPNELSLERGQEPVEVDSCGGGLILYRRNAWLPWMSYKAGDCDHPTLHKQMKSCGSRIFINPSQITLYNKTRYCV